MFDRIRQFLGQRSAIAPVDSLVSRWATSQFLRHQPGENGRFSIYGELQGCPFRAECGPSSRPYIQGLELRIRVNLDLPPVGNVVLMSRVVRNALASSAGPGGSGTNDPTGFQEEGRWLTQLVQTRWSGPPEGFWDSYEVRSDAPDLAQRWLDSNAIDYLTLGSSEAAARVPVVVCLIRGKCYLRMQVNSQAREADTLLALELLEHLSLRALKLASRSGRQL